MDINELTAAVKGFDDPVLSKKLGQIVQLVSLAGTVRPDYAPHLEAATSAVDFFQRVYMDDDLRLEMAWAKIARTLYPCDFVDRFNCEESYEVEVSGGEFTVKSDYDNKSATVPVEGDKVQVRVYRDGGFNELLFWNGRQIGFDFTLAGRKYPAPASMHAFGNIVVLIPWELDERGQRKSLGYKICIS